MDEEVKTEHMMEAQASKQNLSDSVELITSVPHRYEHCTPFRIRDEQSVVIHVESKYCRPKMSCSMLLKMLHSGSLLNFMKPVLLQESCRYSAAVLTSFAHPIHSMMVRYARTDGFFRISLDHVDLVSPTRGVEDCTSRL